MSVPTSDCATESVGRHNLQQMINNPFPKRGQVDIHIHGQILGDFISCGDKPGGIEPGNLVYVRDKNYYEALEAVHKDLQGKTLHDIFNDDINSKITQIANQLAEKYEFERNMSPKKAKALAQKEVVAQITALENFFQTKRTTREIEEAFQKSPVLFGVFQAKIDERNKRIENDKDRVLTWCIKLDFKDSKTKFKHVGPGRRRAQKTNTAKKAGRKKREKAIKRAQQKGYSQEKTERKAQEAYRSGVRKVAFFHNLGRWFSGNKLEQSIDATLEKVATLHARDSGMDVQDIATIEGSWSNDPKNPKTLVAIVWEKSFSTFEDLQDDGYSFSGGDSLSDSSYLSKDGRSQSHEIQGLGRQLALALRHGDRDMIGKAGQNKGFKEENGKKHFFGIDFGHAFAKKDLLDTLQDDFTFLQPTDSDGKNLVNYAMFYDTEVTDRMAGIHIIAKQHGIQVPEEVKKDFPEVWENKDIQKGGHVKAFNDELKDLNDKIRVVDDSITALKDQRKGAGIKERFKINKEIKQHKAKIKGYKKMMRKVARVRDISMNNDNKILQVFQDKLGLMADELTLGENLEKLISPDVSNKSADGQVTLNHLRVPRESRVPVRFEMADVVDNMGRLMRRPKVDDNGDYILNIEGSLENDNLQRFIQENHILGITFDEQNKQIHVRADKVGELAQKFSEANILSFKENPQPKLGDTKSVLEQQKGRMNLGTWKRGVVPTSTGPEHTPQPDQPKPPDGSRPRRQTI